MIAGRVILAAAGATGLVGGTPAHSRLERRYEHARREVARRFAARTPGRDIVRFGLPGGRVASGARVRRSLGVLEGMLHPVVAPVAAAPIAAPVVSSTPVAAAPSSGLAACIIQHESGGNPTATNGQYGGIGQWSPSAWAQDGGTQYASSPTGASYSQQLAVLNSEGAAGMQAQQGNFDGC